MTVRDETDHAPRLLVLPTPDDAAAAAAERLIARLGAVPTSVLGLATGTTMEPVYRCLVAAHRAGRVSFAAATSFNLDEYVGLAADDPASYRATMRRMLFDLVDIDPRRTHLPDGMAADPAAEAARYEAAIRDAGGIDLLLLGLGGNGHVGFNEPPADLASPTHVADLAETTRQANRRQFPPDRAVPTQAITMGMGSILAAREIVLLATGPSKRAAVRAMLTGPVSAHVPASLLRRHEQVTVILDRSAATRLTASGGGTRAIAPGVRGSRTRSHY
jgi:glucosamine-6-phosphate deaminase